MTHALSFTTKLLIVSLFIGAAGFAVSSAHAKDAAPGDLVKCPDFSAVYHFGDDGKRYVFQNAQTYFSWQEDFGDVKTISCDDLATLPIGGIVPYRAGARLLKIPTNPTVYATLPNGRLRALASEAQAEQLFGTDWANRVDDIDESFFPKYTVEEALTEDELPEGFLLTDATSGSVLQVDVEGEAVEVDDLVNETEREHLKGLARAIDRIETALDRIVTRREKTQDNTEVRREKASEALERIHVNQENQAERRTFKASEDALASGAKAERALFRAQDGFKHLIGTETAVDLTSVEAFIIEAEANLESARAAYVAGMYVETTELADLSRRASNHALELMGGEGESDDGSTTEDKTTETSSETEHATTEETKSGEDDSTEPSTTDHASETE